MGLIINLLHLLATGCSLYVAYSFIRAFIRSGKFEKISRTDAYAILGIIVPIILATSIPPATSAIKNLNNALHPSPTVTIPSSAPTPTQKVTMQPTLVPIPMSDSYLAAQPGPGCDKRGATWTPQGIDSITCGTTLTVKGSQTRGYLYFQLPNNKGFSANNTINIISNIYGNDCIGLQEQDANTGYLAEYCGDGKWSIYSIDSDGAILQTLAHNITAINASQTISLKLQGTALTFSIGTDATDVHEITVPSAINPSKVAIAYQNNSGGYMTIKNFGYTPIK